MSYLKLHKTTTDFSAGIQSVNQLRDNFQAQFDAFAFEHGTNDTGREPPTLGFGHHATPKVPRAVVRTMLFTSSYGVTLPGTIVVPVCVTSLVRVSVGLFFIGISGLAEWYAQVEATQTSAASQRIVKQNTGLGGSGGPVGIVVECYEKAGSGGDFEAADFDFVAHIYGTTA